MFGLMHIELRCFGSRRLPVISVNRIDGEQVRSRVFN